MQIELIIFTNYEELKKHLNISDEEFCQLKERKALDLFEKFIVTDHLLFRFEEIIKEPRIVIKYQKFLICCI